MFKQYYLCKQQLLFCVRDTVTSLLSGVFLCPIAARLWQCLPFFGMVILMTFVTMLGIDGIASRNFILVSLWSQQLGCKGQGYTRPKIDLKAWRRYYSRPLARIALLMFSVLQIAT